MQHQLFTGLFPNIKSQHYPNMNDWFGMSIGYCASKFGNVVRKNSWTVYAWGCLNNSSYFTPVTGGRLSKLATPATILFIHQSTLAVKNLNTLLLQTQVFWGFVWSYLELKMRHPRCHRLSYLENPWVTRGLLIVRWAPAHTPKEAEQLLQRLAVHTAALGLFARVASRRVV